MRDLLVTIQNITFYDLIDILIAALFLYGAFAVLRQTRSMVALIGFIAFLLTSLLLYLVARAWNLEAMILIFRVFWIVVVLVFLIVFQNELRRALTDLGKLPIFRALFPSRESFVLDEIMQAVQIMASRNVGALIAFERHNPLTPYAGMGTELDSAVTSQLIRTVFTPYAPLHDGALIIKRERMVRAGCILPLSDDPNLPQEMGTRHRAAIGLSEETDAVVLAISEETGAISLAIDGKIERGLKLEDLRHRLEEELDIVPEPVQESEA